MSSHEEPGVIGTTGTDVGSTLQQGQVLTDANRQRWIAVDTGFGWRLVPEGERATATSGIALPASSTWATETGSIIEVSGSGAIIGTRAIPASLFFGDGGGGGAAPAFSSTRAAADLAFQQQQTLDQQAFDRQQRTEAERRGFENQQRIRRERFDAEQNRLAQEAATRRGRVDALTSLIERFVGAQQDATATLANLQPDAFAFAAGAQGLPVLGTTPTEGFRDVLTEFKDRPTPSFDPEGSIASLDAAIEGLTGQQSPTAPGTFGLAHGGVVPFEGTVVNGGRVGTNKTARLVGEEGSVIAPGTEVMISSPQGAEIIPLEMGLAHGGGVPFDTGTLQPALAPLFESLGFNFTPRLQAADEPSGNLGFRASGIGGAAGLQRLGIRPTIIRRPGEGLFFREGQNLRPLSFDQFQEFGFRPQDVLSFGSGTSFNTFLGNEGLSIGDPLTQAPGINPAALGPPAAFGPFTGLIREPTRGTILPAPFKVAAPLRRLASTNPDLFELLLSAYDAAEFPRSAVISQIQAATPTGTARTAVGLR